MVQPTNTEEKKEPIPEVPKKKIKFSLVPPVGLEVPRLSFKDTFFRLTEWTTPTKFESMWWYLIPEAPNRKSIRKIDRDQNFIVEVANEDGTPSRVMFSCHLDTAGWEFVKIIRQYGDNGAVCTDGKSILGADCKIGAALMIQMIWNNVPGQYVFHAGEERGRIGSEARARLYDRGTHDYCIAFDRKGYDSVITHQMGRRTCSDEFGIQLALELWEDGSVEYELDPTGSYTDSYSYYSKIAECTNISVGYFNQHTNAEIQDLDWAEILLTKLIACRWDTLPVIRKPEEYEYKNRKVHTSHWKGNVIDNRIQTDWDPDAYGEGDSYAGHGGQHRPLVGSPSVETTIPVADAKSKSIVQVSKKGGLAPDADDINAKCDHCRKGFCTTRKYLIDLGWLCGDCYDLLKQLSVEGRREYTNPKDNGNYDDYCRHHWSATDPDFLSEEEWKQKYATIPSSGPMSVTTRTLGKAKRRREKNKRRRNKVG